MNYVLGELSDLGLLTQQLYAVDVVTQPIDLAWLAAGYEGCYVEDPGRLGRALGWAPRTIYFPRTTFLQLARALRGQRRKCSSMRDTLRHEYGHAFAVEHPALIRRSAKFARVFGGRYDDAMSQDDYSDEDFVTEYAATNPSEDFAETFMTYVRRRGRIDGYGGRPGVTRKLRFVASLQSKVRRHALVLDA